MYGGTVIVAIVYYHVYGKHVYDGPVVLCKQDF